MGWHLVIAHSRVAGRRGGTGPGWHLKTGIGPAEALSTCEKKILNVSVIFYCYTWFLVLSYHILEQRFGHGYVEETAVNCVNYKTQ